MYRSKRDESHFTNAQKVAWDHVLPYQNLCILGSDIGEAENLAQFLEETFTPKALEEAASKIGESE